MTGWGILLLVSFFLMPMIFPAVEARKWWACALWWGFLLALAIRWWRPCLVLLTVAVLHDGYRAMQAGGRWWGYAITFCGLAGLIYFLLLRTTKHKEGILATDEPKCGKTRTSAHTWAGCTCSKCGKIRDEGHDWKGCKCLACGKARDEGHDWSENCEKCAACGKIRQQAHNWNGIKCSTCGAISEDDLFYEKAKAKKTVYALETFLERYRNGPCAKDARKDIQDLLKESWMPDFTGAGVRTEWDIRDCHCRLLEPMVKIGRIRYLFAIEVRKITHLNIAFIVALERSGVGMFIGISRHENHSNCGVFSSDDIDDFKKRAVELIEMNLDVLNRE